MQPTLGFIGIGLMGRPMVLRLLAAGFVVNVYNRSEGKLAEVVAGGAVACPDIAALVEASDIVMLCVSDSDAVNAVVFGEKGIAAYLERTNTDTSDKLLVDFSSIAPDATQDFAQRLAPLGMKWIDSPVSGGVAGAQAGTLAIMAGGDACDIDKMKPIWEHLGQRVTHMGPVGAGQTTKIANQMIVSCNVLVMAEVLALAEKGGVDASKIPQALQGGFADSTPLQITGTRMGNHDFDAITWHVKTLLKDLNMAKTLAQQVNADTPMAALGASIMQQHSEQGFHDQDPCTLIKRYSDK